MELGQRVSSAAVIGGDDRLPPAAHPDAWTGRPGTRVPHLWVSRDGQRTSTVDLFTEYLTLLSADARWIEAARAVAQATGVGIGTIEAERDVRFPAERSLEEVLGISAEVACLVRPDAIVAWRSTDRIADRQIVLQQVVARITGCGG